MKKTGKKRLAIVLTLALFLGLMQVALPDNEKVARAADILIDSTGDGENYSVAEGKLLISKKGTYKLSSAVSIKQITVEAGASGSTLDLNGQTVNTEMTACVVISENTSLTIKATGGGTLTGSASGTYRVINIGDGGSLNLSGGTIKLNRHAGVAIGKGSTFTMSGGTITGCMTGVVDVGMNGKFIMEGGSITENECGVELSLETSAELKGGTIKGNSASGVHLIHGKCSLSGSIDVSEQSGTAPDFSFKEAMIVNGYKEKSSDTLRIAENSSTLVHSSPTKDGKAMELHEDSKTGTDVTEKFKTASTSTKELYVVWKTAATQTAVPTASAAPSATPNPSASALPSGSPNPSASANPSANPSASPVVSATPVASSNPNPSVTPFPTLRPEINDDLKVTYPNASEETIQKIVTYANENKISEEVLVLPDTLIEYDTEEDPEGATFGKLRLRIAKRSKKNMLLKWKRLKEADGYILYGNHCNTKDKKYKLEEITQPSKSDSNFVAKKVAAGKLTKGTYYKFLIYAYKEFDGQKVPIAASVCVHGTTKGNKKNTVARAIKVFRKKYGSKRPVSDTIKFSKNDTWKLLFEEVPEESSKTIRHHRKVFIESDNPEIFTASRKTGVIRAVKSGTATLYVYAQNGVYKKIKVVVR